MLTTLKNLDFTDPESLQNFPDVALEFYTPVIAVLSVALVLILVRWELLKRCVQRCGDSIVNYQWTLVAAFGVCTTSLLIGLIVFIYGNQLVRDGTLNLLRKVPSAIFQHLSLVTQSAEICPLTNVSDEVTVFAQTIRDLEANTEALVASFERYVIYYDDVVATSLVFLFTLLLLTVGRVVSGVYSQQLDTTRFQILSLSLRTCFNVTAVSYAKELLLLILLLLVTVVMVASRLVAAIGVAICPTVDTLEYALEQSGLLESTFDNATGVVPREMFDYFIKCPDNSSGSGSGNLFGIDLNASTSAFFDTFTDLGFQCTANETLVCSNSSLPCGFYEQNSTNFDLICPCSTYVQDISALLANCDVTADLIGDAFETYFCDMLVQGSALIYISSIMVMLATLLLMLVFRVLSPTLSKINYMPDLA